MPTKHASRNIEVITFIISLIYIGASVFFGSAGTSWGSTFISISDIHFNPFYDPSIMEQLTKTDSEGWDKVFGKSVVTGLGDYGNEETNYNLFLSTLKNMGNPGEKPDFIIFTGDILAHDFNARFRQFKPDSSKEELDRFILKTVKFVINGLSHVFPSAEIFFSLGNTDSYNGDYAIAPKGKFLRDTSNTIYEEFFKKSENKEKFLKTYTEGGYYSKSVPGLQKARIISLNTVFFSVKYENTSPSNMYYDPARKELEWLAKELKSAAGQNERVWLLLHIPVGINIYSTRHKFLDDSGKLTDVLPFWKPQYSRRFLVLTDVYSQIIKAMFAGHTHMDTFRVTKSGNREVDPSCFIHVSPAISPQFGNNPGYEVFTYDKGDFTLTDYEVHYLNLENSAIGVDSPWVLEYSFAEAYQVTSISSRSLNKLLVKFENNSDLRSLWMKYYNVSHTSAPGITHKDWKSYWLGMGKLIENNYLSCFNH